MTARIKFHIPALGTKRNSDWLVRKYRKKHIQLCVMLTTQPIVSNRTAKLVLPIAFSIRFPMSRKPKKAKMRLSISVHINELDTIR